MAARKAKMNAQLIWIDREFDNPDKLECPKCKAPNMFLVQIGPSIAYCGKCRSQFIARLKCPHCSEICEDPIHACPKKLTKYDLRTMAKMVTDSDGMTQAKPAPDTKKDVA